MKKSLFIILSCMLAAFIITGCSEDSDNNSGNSSTGTEGGNTTPDYSKELTGTYTVELFATLSPSPLGSGNIFMTTNCSEAVKKGWATLETTYLADNEKPVCQNEGNVNMIGGKVTFEKNEEGLLIIKSKMQLWHSIMTISPNDTYQYVEYAPVPVSNLTDNTINKGNNSVKGVSGRHLTAKTSNPDSTFYFEVNEDGTIFNNLLLVGKEVYGQKINPINYVILKKEKDEVEVLDPNNLFKETIGDKTADDAFAKFVKDVK